MALSTITHLNGLTITSQNSRSTAIGFGDDGTLYAENGQLYWEDRDGNTHKLTFPKNEIVTNLLNDL